MCYILCILSEELNLYFGSPDVPVKLTQMHILNLEVTFLLLAVYNIRVC